jgi:hypothetical protein
MIKNASNFSKKCKFLNFFFDLLNFIILIFHLFFLFRFFAIFSTTMKYTHAIMLRFPSSLKIEDKKLKNKIDLALAARQHKDLSDTLREVVIDFINLFYSKNFFNF